MCWRAHRLVCHITVTHIDTIYTYYTNTYTIYTYGNLFSNMCVIAEIPLDFLVSVGGHPWVQHSLHWRRCLSRFQYIIHSLTIIIFLYVYVEHLKLLLPFILLFWRFRSILGVHDSCVYLKCVPPLGVDHVLKELDSAFQHRLVYICTCSACHCLLLCTVCTWVCDMTAWGL